MAVFQKRSVITGNINTMELPITEKEVEAWQDSGELVQNFFPQLTPDQREFLVTGATPEEWDEAFPPEDEDDDLLTYEDIEHLLQNPSIHI